MWICFPFKCSTHFVRHHSFVMAAMILWKVTLTAYEDVASDRFLDCRKKTLGGDMRVWSACLEGWEQLVLAGILHPHKEAKGVWLFCKRPGHNSFWMLLKSLSLRSSGIPSVQNCRRSVLLFLELVSNLLSKRRHTTVSDFKELLRRFFLL